MRDEIFYTICAYVGGDVFENITNFGKLIWRNNTAYKICMKTIHVQNLFTAQTTVHSLFKLAGMVG